MKHQIASLLGLVLMPQQTFSVAHATGKDKEENRLKDCGTVLEENLDVPDNIPKDLLDKAAW